MTEHDRLWSYIDRRGPDECWPWTGGTGSKGYGALEVKRDGRWTSVGAHRLVLAEKLGRPLEPGEQALHSDSCGGNRLCCNPAHLRAGDHDENMLDKARAGTVAGERNPFSKLSDAERDLIRNDSRSLAVLAREFGVTKQAIAWVKRHPVNRS